MHYMAANTIRTIMIIIIGSEMVLCSHGAGFSLLPAHTGPTHTGEEANPAEEEGVRTGLQCFPV